MKKSGNYTGIDYFRIISAILIIAIHTSPLTSYSETADFILTRIIARIAVPFFFMTSGFFLISRYTPNAKKLAVFVKKMALIYGAATLLYIPLNIYKGTFKMDNFLPNIIKDILFDGTFYHLWYLPASAMGAVIAWYLVKRWDYAKALIITGILYGIGLFGDSYFGIAENISFMKALYNQLFLISDYTRNGIFFAPIFFVLGGMIADSSLKISLKINAVGFAFFSILLFVEAMLLHSFKMQRHDSMYIFLLPCMYFLFQILLYWKGKKRSALRFAALIIYIIHPMMIIVVRLFAKLLGANKLLVENSLIHFLMVAVLSVVLSMVITFFSRKYRRNKNRPCGDTDRAWIELRMNNLAHNVRVIQRELPEKCSLMAVVKTQAYGHGAFKIAASLNQMGINAFAVATIDEGIQLRKFGIRGEILILGYTNPNCARALKKYDLSQTLIDFNYAAALNKQKVPVKVHIKIDTGMHRLGISSQNISEVQSIFAMKYMKIEGIYTHLCCADSLLPSDVVYTQNQIDRFYQLIEALKKDNITIPKLHIQSSYGLFNYPKLHCDYVRIGIALYGVSSKPNQTTQLQPDLRPVLALKSRVILIRSVCKGESVGYNRSFTADRDCMIAILPIGYGDGFPRGLSENKGSVLIHGQLAPIVGKICMDQLFIDITEIQNVSVGDVAVLIGFDKIALLAPMVAENAESISNELLCRMGARLPVVTK